MKNHSNIAANEKHKPERAETNHISFRQHVHQKQARTCTALHAGVPFNEFQDAHTL